MKKMKIDDSVRLDEINKATANCEECQRLLFQSLCSKHEKLREEFWKTIQGR